MKIESLKTLSLLINLSETVGNYKQSDFLIKKLVRFAQAAEQPQQFIEGTELQPGIEYKVQTNDNSIFDKVAQTGEPDYATVGNVKVLVTHGSADGMWLIPKSIHQNFYSNNPKFKETGQLDEQDTNSGIVASYEQGKDRLWLNAQGMQKYAGAKWVGCYDYISGKGFGAFGGSKGKVGVVTKTGPEGQETYLQVGN